MKVGWLVDLGAEIDVGSGIDIWIYNEVYSIFIDEVGV